MGYGFNVVECSWPVGSNGASEVQRGVRAFARNPAKRWKRRFKRADNQPVCCLNGGDPNSGGGECEVLAVDAR
jgi:hypothetical protein